MKIPDEDNPKPLPQYRLARINACCFCLKRMGFGPRQTRILTACTVTDEGGRRWCIFLCPECYEAAEARERRLEMQEERRIKRESKKE
jgi:hypothetical protein